MDGIERKLLGVCGFGKVVVNAVADVDVKIFSAKGGITFSGIGTKALKVRRALVMGQIRPGIPVWQTGEGAGDKSQPPDIYIVWRGRNYQR